MLAAGTGIAPMIPVIKNILHNEEDETFVSLFYACKTYQDILCKKQLDEWQQFWNFKCLYVLSQQVGIYFSLSMFKEDIAAGSTATIFIGSVCILVC